MGKRPGSPENEAVKRKRARTVDARRIVVQSAEQALTEGRLDVRRYVEARKFEIKQLDNAILKSKASSKQRAFQTLPRDMRRRTASHNVKRVPKRIRKRAQAEMQDDNTPGLKRKKLRGSDRIKAKAMEQVLKKAKQDSKAGSDDEAAVLKNVDLTGINCLADRPKGKPKFQSRQKDKVWLPTHVWHVKRAHMDTLWGYSIPITPTQKGYRSTHRCASYSGSVAWETSYFCTLILKGESDEISAVLDELAPGAYAPKFLSGKRSWEGMLYDAGNIPLGPGLVYFGAPSSGDLTTRWVLLRLHPSIFEAVYQVVDVLCSTKKLLEIHDCRYSIGSIELLGPKSLDALQCVLHPVESDSHVAKSWRMLSGLTNASSLPQSVALTLDVHDPRLFYPPVKTRKSSTDKIMSVICNWPDAVCSDLFTVEGRKRSYETQATLKQLNKRRSENKPGSHITPDANDPIIPVVLLKRKADKWTLLAPWCWIQPLWYTLMHVQDVKLGSMSQDHQISYERGLAHFPDDYPGTDAGHLIDWLKSKKLREEWQRKPSAKRVAFDKVQTCNLYRGEDGDPFMCDWTLLSQLLDDNLSQSPVLTYGSAGPVSSAMTNVLTPTDQMPTRAVVQGNDRGGLVGVSPVRLRYLHRGSPQARARIYRIPSSVKDEWLNILNSTDKIDMSKYPSCPSKEYLIGYVTTGDFNLSDGLGVGIGSIRTSRMTDDRLCLVRNVGHNTARLARWEALDVQ
jgi:ribonuclease P/MRP protein subunit POP1